MLIQNDWIDEREIESVTNFREVFEYKFGCFGKLKSKISKGFRFDVIMKRNDGKYYFHYDKLEDAKREMDTIIKYLEDRINMLGGDNCD